MDSLKEIEIQQQVAKQKVAEKPMTDNRMSYEARKEYNKQLKRLEKTIESCESEIDRLEKQVQQTVTMMATPEGAMNTALAQLHAKSVIELESRMQAWEDANLELETLKNQA